VDVIVSALLAFAVRIKWGNECEAPSLVLVHGVRCEEAGGNLTKEVPGDTKVQCKLFTQVFLGHSLHTTSFVWGIG
jgi:hypothetical protein